MSEMDSVSPIAVLGAGSWGTALAIHLAKRGQQAVRLWGRDAVQMQAMQETRCNARYLPDCSFPDDVQVYANLAEALDGVQDVLCVVPSQGFRALLEQVKGLHPQPASLRWLWATKGLAKDGEGLGLLSDTIVDVYGAGTAMAILSGPSFAKEVATGQATAIVAASTDEALLADTVARFHHGHFRVYTSHDSVGVQIGGVMKNVLAVAAGIADGLGLGANARSALITRGMAEMMRLGEHVGAQTQSLMGLAGLGDVVLSCTSDMSRNRRLGLTLGQGQSAEAAQQAIGQVVESVWHIARVHDYAQAHAIAMPITAALAHMLTGEVTAQQALDALLARDAKAEDA